MAIMIPSVIDRDHVSGGEITLFDLFQELPGDFYIFHSVPWQQKQYGTRARVQTGEADFLVFVPNRGLICFEVKDGDIAFTRDQGWLQINRSSRESKPINPFYQAERSQYYFLDILKQKFGGLPPFFVGSAVWFTSIENRNIPAGLPHGSHRDIILTADDMANATSIEMGLHRILNYYGAPRLENPQDYLQKTLDALMPELQIFASPKALLSETTRVFHRMTYEQNSLLDYIEEQQVATIKGIAGTGKTILAVEKAKRLSKDGQVLFLCFNTFLRTHLEKTYAQDGITFTNLDSLLVQLSGSPLPLERHNPGEKDNQILEMLINWDLYNLPFKHFVIDEGQDFLEDHLLAIQEIAQQMDGCFYVFFDAHQFVQGREFPEWLKNADCRLVLSRNCRNTKEIALTSTKPMNIQERELRLLQDNIPNTGKPSIMFIENPAEAKRSLLKLIQEKMDKGLSLEQIVVLTTGSTENSMLNPGDFCLAPGIQLNLQPSQGKVFFTTIRKFKGLEAEAVILLDVGVQTFSSEAQRRAFYVGASRAKIWLDILITTKDTQEMNLLANAMTGETIAANRSKFAIANWLQVVVRQ